MKISQKGVFIFLNLDCLLEFFHNMSKDSRFDTFAALDRISSMGLHAQITSRLSCWISQIIWRSRDSPFPRPRRVIRVNRPLTRTSLVRVLSSFTTLAKIILTGYLGSCLIRKSHQPQGSHLFTIFLQCSENGIGLMN